MILESWENNRIWGIWFSKTTHWCSGPWSIEPHMVQQYGAAVQKGQLGTGEVLLIDRIIICFLNKMQHILQFSADVALFLWHRNT